MQIIFTVNADLPDDNRTITIKIGDVEVTSQQFHAKSETARKIALSLLEAAHGLLETEPDIKESEE